MKSKQSRALIAAVSLFAAGASARACSMGDMPMKDHGMHGCMGMDGMHMKGMDRPMCMDMMRGHDGKEAAHPGQPMSHRTDAVVKHVDASQGKVTLAHEPVKSLNWPAMTMAFVVNERSVLDKLSVGRKVHVEFQQEENQYVITAVK
jgi:Cu(I)/Ag(I) efflux system protein CusF